MKNAYILKTDKNTLQSFFNEGVWTHDTTTSVLLRKDNGKIIQVFGYGKNGSYDYLKNETIKLISNGTLRCIGYATFVKYCDTINISATAHYVFK